MYFPIAVQFFLKEWLNFASLLEKRLETGDICDCQVLKYILNPNSTPRTVLATCPSPRTMHRMEQTAAALRCNKEVQPVLGSRLHIGTSHLPRASPSLLKMGYLVKHHRPPLP